MNPSKKTLLYTAGFLLIFLLLCNTYFYQLLFTGPSFVHAWAQGDRYSLAVNFYDNGMNFFLPATSNLTSENGITGVEFPIQAYLAAALGHVFGRDNISVCFKLITILVSGAGLYFLFLTVYKKTRDFIFSLTLPVFIFCSPVFIFYTCNYLPDTAGASLAFISFYYVLNYIETSSHKSRYTALLFLMLGTLVKTSIGLYLLGFIGFIILSTFSRKKPFLLKDNISLYVTSLLFLAPVIAYFFYNQYLNAKYAPYIFISKAMPFRSFDSFKEYANGIFKSRWMYDYLALPQYLMAAAIIAPGIYLMRKEGTAKKHLLLLTLFLLGALGMFYLMGEQFAGHDYYIIAIAFPLIAYALVTSIIHIHKNASGIALPSLRITLVAALAFSFFFGSHQYSKRFNDSSDIYRWSMNGAQILDGLGISRKEPILLVNEYPSNLALTYFDRRGYNFYYSTWDYNIYPVTHFLKEKGVRIITMRTQTEKRITGADPNAFAAFDHLITKDELAVYRLKEAN